MQEIENFDIGDKVKHPKFGTGTVMFRTGEGEMQKVTVKFGSDVGEKKLLVSLANLKLISERPTLAPEAAPVEAVPGRTRLKADDDDDDDDDDKALPLDDDDDDDDDEEVIVIDDEDLAEDDEEIEIEEEDEE